MSEIRKNAYGEMIDCSILLGKTLDEAKKVLPEGVESLEVDVIDGEGQLVIMNEVFARLGVEIENNVIVKIGEFG